MKIWRTHLPGLALVLALVGLAFGVTHFSGVNLGLVAIALGFLFRAVFGLPDWSDAGVRWCESHGLSIAVALLGLQMPLSALAGMPFGLVLLIFGSTLFTFLLTLILWRLLRLSTKTGVLVASGQAICGSAAVMATQKVIQGPAAKAAMVIGVINLLGFLGVLVLPELVGWWLHDAENSLGLFLGNSLQSMGHVVAAAWSVGDSVEQAAVLIKMGRILLLIPLVLVLSWWFQGGGRSGTATTGWWQWVPWFIVAFVLLCLLGYSGLISPTQIEWSAKFGGGLFLLALCAIGLNTDVRAVRESGWRILVLAGLVFLGQVLFNLVALSIWPLGS